MLKERLSSLRAGTKMTQSEMAKKLGIARTTYAGYENGSRRPDPETLQKLADIFEVSLDFLLGRTDDPNPPKPKIFISYGTDLNSVKIPNEFYPHEDFSLYENRLKTFTYRLKKGFEDKNISIELAAIKCGVTEEYIQRLLTNQKKLPGTSTLYNLADLIGVTPDYLGGFSDDPQGYSPDTPRPKDMEDFLDKEEVMFKGVPLTTEDKEKVKNVLAAIFMDATKKNKRKK